MRYGNPSLKHSLQKIQKGKYSTLTVLPMFPQYASATSGSVIEAVLNEIKTQNTIPNIHIINQFYNNKHYIETFTKKIKTYSPEDYDHILFSYHGLPKRQINKCHPEIKQAQCNCAQMFPKHGDFCYQAICFETSRLLAQKMELAHNSYSTSFQSHMSKNWTGPFTSDILIQRAQNGDKNILVIAPSFVTDCLETTLEIGEEYAELFQQYGGKKLTLVNSLNDDDNWAKTILEIINNEYRTP
jgi:ferrochelatase